MASAIRPMTSLGYRKITGLNTVKDLSPIPDFARAVRLKVETQSIRFRDDGTNPSSTDGMLMTATDPVMFYEGPLSQLKMIELAASAVVHVTFYADA